MRACKSESCPSGWLGLSLGVAGGWGWHRAPASGRHNEGRHDSPLSHSQKSESLPRSGMRAARSSPSSCAGGDLGWSRLVGRGFLFLLMIPASSQWKHRQRTSLKTVRGWRGKSQTSDARGPGRDGESIPDDTGILAAPAPAPFPRENPREPPGRAGLRALPALSLSPREHCHLPAAGGKRRGAQTRPGPAAPGNPLPPHAGRQRGRADGWVEGAGGEHF